MASAAEETSRNVSVLSLTTPDFSAMIRTSWYHFLCHLLCLFYVPGYEDTCMDVGICGGREAHNCMHTNYLCVGHLGDFYRILCPLNDHSDPSSGTKILLKGISSTSTSTSSDIFIALPSTLPG